MLIHLLFSWQHSFSFNIINIHSACVWHLSRVNTLLLCLLIIALLLHCSNIFVGWAPDHLLQQLFKSHSLFKCRKLKKLEPCCITKQSSVGAGRACRREQCCGCTPGMICSHQQQTGFPGLTLQCGSCNKDRGLLKAWKGAGSREEGGSGVSGKVQ